MIKRAAVLMMLVCSLALPFAAGQERKEFADYKDMRAYLGELFQQKKFAEAASLLESVLDRFPDNLAANTFNLAAARVNLGENDKAVEALEEGLRRGVFYGLWDFVAKFWDPLRETPRFQGFPQGQPGPRRRGPEQGRHADRGRYARGLRPVPEVPPLHRPARRRRIHRRVQAPLDLVPAPVRVHHGLRPIDAGGEHAGFPLAGRLPDPARRRGRLQAGPRKVSRRRRAGPHRRLLVGRIRRDGRGFRKPVPGPRLRRPVSGRPGDAPRRGHRVGDGPRACAGRS